VHELRAELDALRAHLAEGVTTRRLAVVGPDGFERIHLTAEGAHAHVVVRARTADDGADPTQADLYALDAEDETDRPTVGLDLTRDGDPATRVALPVEDPPDPHRFLDPDPH